jgi:hypothetical protein
VQKAHSVQERGTERLRLTVRDQYLSRSSFVVNVSPSCSKGVRPIKISKKVTPSDQTSALRVSCDRPLARSGARYCNCAIVVNGMSTQNERNAYLRCSVRQTAVKGTMCLNVIVFCKTEINDDWCVRIGEKDIGRSGKHG